MNKNQIYLPRVQYKSKISLEEALLKRRSERIFTPRAITMEQLSQILWAAQGITHDNGQRTAPSAGATYPMEIYILVEKVNDLPSGLYKYLPDAHQIENQTLQHLAKDLYSASLEEAALLKTPVVIIITADYTRTCRHYGERGYRYVHMEAGLIAENISLQLVSLNLKTFIIGAFNDVEVKTILAIKEDPLLLMPIGYI